MMSAISLRDTLIPPKKNPNAILLCWAIAILMLIGFCLPECRLTSVWGTGHNGATSSMTALICRSYHKAPVEVSSLMPAIYRYSSGKAGENSYYYSHFPWIYVFYGAVTKLIGTSEIAIRLITIAICFFGAWLLVKLLRQQSDMTALAGFILYASCPLTFLYGDMAEHYLPISIGLMLATWAYGEFYDNLIDLKKFILFCLPLATMSSFMMAFFIGAVFISHIAIKREIKKAFVACVAIGLVWMVFFAIHLYIVKETAGTLDVFFGRGESRGLLAAFKTLEHPVYDVFRNFTERLGIPLCLLFVYGLWRALRSRTRNNKRLAISAVAGISCLSFVICFFELVAIHRYALQLFVPSLALAASPAFRHLIQSRWKKHKITAGIIIALCFGMFMHRIMRFEGADQYEKTLARIGKEISSATPEDKPVLMIVKKNIMGEKHSIMYYTKRPVIRLLISEIDRAKEWDFSAVICCKVDDRINEISLHTGIKPEGFKLFKNLEDKPLGIMVGSR